MIALVYITTMFIKIPYSGQGYFNIGDSIMLFATIFFGPIEGIIAGVIGSAIADLTSGFPIYIYFTIIAKGLEGLSAYFLFKILKKHKIAKFSSLFIAPLFMVVTYFVAYIVLGDIQYALVTSPFDLLQGLICSIIATILLLAFKNIHTPLNMNK